MSHQNQHGYEQYGQKMREMREWVQVVKAKVMGVINDLNVVKRNHERSEVGAIVTDVLQRNNDMLQVLSREF